MTFKNGNWKVAATILAAAVSVIVILGYVNGGVDGRIDNKINVHSREQEVVQHLMQQDIAVIQVQQQTIQDDIGEIKEMIRNQ